ncbi:MAG TPA: HD domain-containing protein [Bacillota bacterium]|nr:HD domain-containing protein [Bacillota bacterium]HOB86399.1 HD domain-containing protein [Bacillota bacterium]HOP68593.1 HD domain-containing protein [Bacillota bacterium]HPT33326.1 HD domain-containing protein [Bacillota bacterium]HPZ64000.1 HD domain-containing protein [Bacillota bacterium]
MERINRLIFDEEYRLYLLKNKAPEETRIFCKHDFEHLLNVARLTYLLLLEEGCPFISKEQAYAAGLLHDIGRWKEYLDGVDHAEYGAQLAEPILHRSGFQPEEIDLIVEAIRQHRGKIDPQEPLSPLGRALRQADQLSRLCFMCTALSDCKQIINRPNIEGLIS